MDFFHEKPHPFMVDTINFLARWPLNAEIVAELKKQGFCQWEGWYLEVARRPDPLTGEVASRLTGSHRDSGAWVKGKDFVIEWVQASLPRVLFGYNGRLILDPFQLTAAHDRLFELLEVIARAEERLIEYTRVDLVLNLKCDPRRMAAIHRGARHPWVRREHIEYGKDGVRFAGKERSLNLYCKQRERADKTGFQMPELRHSIRAEVQLRNKTVVREAFTYYQDNPVGKLDYLSCYRVFRRAWCAFDKKSLGKQGLGKITLAGLIAECEAQGFETSAGISALEWWEQSGRKPATARRVKAAIQKGKAELMQFRWEDLLPPLRPPRPLIDIYRDGREEEVETMW